MHRRVFAAGLCGLVTATFLLCFAWAVVLPPLSGPDERSHMSSVVRLADGRGWPLPYEADLEQAVRIAQHESGTTWPDVEPLAALPGPGERSSLAGADVPGVPYARDRMVQHPPGGYVLAAGALRAVGGLDAPWDRALLAMRLASAVFMAAAVGFAGVAVRAITGSGSAGLVGAAALVGIPLFTATGGYVSNDPALIATVTASLACIAVARTSSRPWVWLLLAGVAAGLALLAKGLALLVLPTLGLLGLLVTRPTLRGARPSEVARRVALAMLPALVAVVVGGWWWVRNLILLGRVQPSVLGDVTPRELEEPYDLWFFLTGFVDRFNQLFWSRGAREWMTLPEWMGDVAGVVLLAVLVAAVVVRRHRAWVLALAVYPLAIITTIGLNAHRIYVTIGLPDRGVQGRYVFSGLLLVALAVAVVGGRLGRRLAPATRTVVAAAAPVGAIGVAVGYLAWVVLQVDVHSEGQGLGGPLREAAWAMGVATAVVPALVLGAVVAGAAGLLALGLDRRRASAGPVEESRDDVPAEPEVSVRV